MNTRITSFSRPSNSFFGNIFKVVIGTAFAQALGILTVPIVSRLFSPAALGAEKLVWDREDGRENPQIGHAS
jgi:hypothetical protein